MGAINLIFLDKEDVSRELTSENLKVYTGMNIISFDNIAEAFDFIKDNSSKIEFIISRNNIDEQDTSRQLENFLKKNNINVNCLILGKYKSMSDTFRYIEEPYTVKDVV